MLGALANACSYNVVAAMVPRWSRCAWKADLLKTTVEATERFRSDIVLIRQAMIGSGAEGAEFQLLSKLRALQD